MVVALVIVPFVVKKLVEVAEVAVKFVVPIEDEVALVMTEDDARRVPGNVKVLTEERYRRVSPNAIPALVAVEEARVKIEEGVVVPSPSLLLVLS